MKIAKFLDKLKSFSSNITKQRRNPWSKIKNHIAATKKIIEMHHKSPEENYKHYYKHGINHLKDRNFVAAIKSFNIALKYDNKQEKALFHKALCFQKMGEYQKALGTYNTALEIEPQGSPNLYLNRGKCFFELGEFENAIEDLSETIKSEHRVFDNAYLYRALSYKAIGKYGQAAFDLTAFLKHRPNSSAVYTLRAKCLQSAGHHNSMYDLPENIINIHEQFLALKEKRPLSTEKTDQEEEIFSSDYYEPYLSKGNELLEKNKYSEAIEAYTKHLEHFPKDYTTYLRRGECWINKGSLYKAIKDFDKAIEFDPKYNMPYFARAWCYAELCDYAASINDYKTFLKLTENDVLLKHHLTQEIYDAQEMLVQVFIKGFFKNELYEFINSLDSQKTESKALYYYAKALEAKDWDFDNNKAIELADKALEQSSKLIEALRLKAEIHQSHIDIAQEISDLEKIIEINSLDVDANLRLGELLRKSNPDRSTKLFINAIEGDFGTASDRYIRDYVQGQTWRAKHDPVVEFINKKKKELGFGPIEKKYTGYGTNHDSNEPESLAVSHKEQQGWNEAMLLTDIKELENQLQNLNTTNDIGIIKESLKAKYQKLLNIYAQSENYEKAAELRDKIAKLKEEEESGER